MKHHLSVIDFVIICIFILGNGVEKYEISFDKKLVRVTCSSSISAEDVLIAIQKTGKVATLINIEPLLSK